MNVGGGNGAEMGFPSYTARRSVGGGALSRGYGTSRSNQRNDPPDFCF